MPTASPLRAGSCAWLYSIGTPKVFWNFQFTFRFLFKVKTNYERSGFSFDIEATADMTGLWSLRNAVWMHAEKTHIVTAESRTIRRVLTVKLKDNNETLKLLTIFRWYFDWFDVQKSWNSIHFFVIKMLNFDGSIFYEKIVF